MSDLGIHIALSGAQAASERLRNSAVNVANAESTSSLIDGETVPQPFKPQEVVQSSIANGGVTTSLQPLVPAAISLFQPESQIANEDGTVEFPNVNLDEERINQLKASVAYASSLKSIQAGEELIASLVNIVG